jgi:aryl-alcohol dehydrogenase-like predicted oxidoreductase
VRYLGASNFSGWRLARALGVSDTHRLHRYVCEQPPYNLLLREQYERDIEPLCLEEGLGVITYSSMADGFLSGKYRPDAPLPESERAAGVRDDYMNDRGWKVLRAVEDIAAKHDARPSHVALAWILARPGITSAIAGATSPEQVRELAEGVALKLTDDEQAALDAVSEWRRQG